MRGKITIEGKVRRRYGKRGSELAHIYAITSRDKKSLFSSIF